MTADGRLIGDTVMEMKNITLRFGGVVAIKDISFDIKEGEIRAIIGPNGAGKSSMLNVINGFYHPQEGEVWYKGARRGNLKPYEIAHQGIARTFQNIALVKGMTTLDNIMTGRLTHMKSGLLSQMIWAGKAEREEIENRELVENIIDFLEIKSIRKTPVGRLPYGLQKRVELGRALAAEPSLLLLDEPMAGMNLEEKEDMSRYILDVNQQFGTTIALIEHDMKDPVHFEFELCKGTFSYVKTKVYNAITSESLFNKQHFDACNAIKTDYPYPEKASRGQRSDVDDQRKAAMIELNKQAIESILFA